MGEKIVENRVTKMAALIQSRLDNLSPERIEALDRGMDLSFEDHFSFQQTQASAFALGKLTLEEAQTVYLALGNGWLSKNGGWSKGTSLAMKVTITKLIGELIGAK
jgi:hypothetical protein